MLFFKEAGPVFWGYMKAKVLLYGAGVEASLHGLSHCVHSSPLAATSLPKSRPPGASVSRSLGLTNEMGGRGLCAGFESWLCLLPAV